MTLYELRTGFVFAITMLPLCVAVVCALLHVSRGTDSHFPPGFLFGAATSSYQIEGGWNADGKGENIWDRLVHNYRHEIKGNATGDVAADSYHLWKEDVKIAFKMGLKFYRHNQVAKIMHQQLALQYDLVEVEIPYYSYNPMPVLANSQALLYWDRSIVTDRFSISWTRILPTGFTSALNEAGVKYYSDLIDALLAKDIEPIVTLYHWELPGTIQDLGGWTNPLIVNWFGDYARVIYSLYADRVKTWLTINEAGVLCDWFYNLGNYAPRIKEPEFGPFLCNKHVMLAHAKAYRIFDHEFRPKYEGRISLANNLVWIEPTASEYSELAELGRQHQIGRYSHPIFSKKGGWPPSVEKVMLEYSLKQGYRSSRLPEFTKKEIEFMKGTADFYGMNHYTTYLIRPAKPEEDPGIWYFNGSPEINARLEMPPGVTYGASSILPVYPEGIRKQLAWLKQQYGDVDIFITENGFSTRSYDLDDHDRVDFIKKYLEQVLLSIKVDNVSVTGYTVWSLIDNFEWLDGYTIKFGLNQVDFNNPNKPRTRRLSSLYYGCVIEHHTTDVPESCFDAKSANKHTKANGASVSTNGGQFFYFLVFIFAFIFAFVCFK